MVILLKFIEELMKWSRVLKECFFLLFGEYSEAKWGRISSFGCQAPLWGKGGKWPFGTTSGVIVCAEKSPPILRRIACMEIQ